MQPTNTDIDLNLVSKALSQKIGEQITIQNIEKAGSPLGIRIGDLAWECEVKTSAHLICAELNNLVRCARRF